MRGTHINGALLLVIVGVCVGCDGANDPCADGHVDTIIVGKDAFVIEGFDQGLLAGGRSEDQVFPYADGSPFLTCTSVGTLLVREVIDGIDGDRDFPGLQELGTIFVDFDDEGGERAVPDVAGFDGLTRLGGIAGILGPEGYASVAEVTGFNAVEQAGALNVPGRIEGFRSLEAVDGNLRAGSLAGPTQLRRVGGTLDVSGRGFRGDLELAALEEVGGDLIVSSTRLTSISFRALSRVGGDYLVEGNPFEQFAGAQPGARIEGDFTAQFNLPPNSVFENWLDDERIVVGGRVKVCLNGDPAEEGDTCNEI